MSLVTFEIVKGNPGAMTFLMDAYGKDMFKAETGFQRMRDAGITGSRLYMLWNDCCNRATEWAMEIMVSEEISTIRNHIDGGNGRGIPFAAGAMAGGD